MCFEVEKLQGNSPVRALVRKTVQAIAPKPTGLAREILEIDGSLLDDATAAMNLAYWIDKRHDVGLARAVVRTGSMRPISFGQNRRREE